MFVDSWSTFSRPRSAAGLTDKLVTRRSKTYAALGRKGVGDEAGISEREGRAPAGAVEHRTGILGAVRSDAINLQRHPVVERARYGSADDGNAAHGALVADRDRELVANARRVVPMIAPHEFISLIQFAGDNSQPHRPSLSPLTRVRFPPAAPGKENETRTPLQGEGGMASLVLRGNMWHLAWRWRGKQKWKSTKVEHDGKFRHGAPVPPATAKRELRRLENSLDTGHSFDTKTLSELLDLVEKEYEVAGYKSAGSLKSRLEHLRDWFGNLRADRIVENDFLEYAEFRRKSVDGTPGAANNTINRELEVLMKALRLGKISPLPKLKKLPRPKPRQGFFDDAKVAALCRHLPEYLRAPTMFGYYTGWRREECFGLELKDVDFASGEIRLWESKNGEARVFPMDAVPGLRELLVAAKTAIATAGKTEQRKRFQADTVNPKPVAAVTPFIFARYLKTLRQFRRITEFRKAWETACNKAGCPGMLFHDLRRSAARNLELAGWPRSLIMQWMGHETESMFHYYRIVSAADREVVSRALEERKKATGK